VRAAPRPDRPETPPLVSQIQLIEFVAGFPGGLSRPQAVRQPPSDEPLQAPFTYAQIYPHCEIGAGGVLEKEQLGAQC